MKFFTPTKGAMIATLTSIVLATIKFIVAISTGSIVVLASAIDSLLDICMSAFNYFALKKAQKPATKHFNYGFEKIQYIAAMIEGIVILFSAGYIFYKAILHLDSKTPLVDAKIAIWVMILSIVVVSILIVFLGKIARSTKNEVIKTDILHYKSDLFSNGAILLSLLIIEFSGFYLIDSIFGILIAIYIAYSSLGIIKTAVVTLLDSALDENTQNSILEVLENSSILGYRNLKTRIAGDRVFVVVDLIFAEKITLLSAHQITDDIEDRIRKIDLSKRWDIIIHLEPVEYFKDSHSSFIKKESF
ncbi:cation diffusion facilitator family transporter [Helicobacter cappadocius]|uniref:Cation diffusion facilitator family transporter n=1 Tax=Helicobacter cappadocius TaxID=3063998 RepID=A0AA90PLL3_9HELI|nr:MULTISPECIES: cation diffusion facilitator family transporter [unclassified Helicobacter]MDO7253727.1 cation diffusion facilitator family transporter [Helicobacter sp. faydin-H75]MDP2539655.1 cation diffusion facilitator family transporter [Helicobacter sp. faydin-H76]